nr:unnamed protein product [Callosobruchus analis]
MDNNMDKVEGMGLGVSADPISLELPQLQKLKYSAREKSKVDISQLSVVHIIHILAEPINLTHRFSNYLWKEKHNIRFKKSIHNKHSNGLWTAHYSNAVKQAQMSSL